MPNNKITKSLEELVGNTPLFEPVRYEQKNNLEANILVKLEWFNASGSIKARANDPDAGNGESRSLRLSSGGTGCYNEGDRSQIGGFHAHRY